MKPLSCHLYPVRISDLGESVDAMNYHKWHICQKALEKDIRKNPVICISSGSPDKKVRKNLV